MIQRFVTVAALAAITLVPVATALAADQAATKPAATSTAKVHHMTAQVKSVNADAKTLTVSRRMGRTATFTVAPEALGSLADLKPGERVRIAYERSAGTLTAESIVPAPSHAATK